MSQEEFQVVFTCGLCDTVCDDYIGHPCLDGYNDVHLDEDYYFYPLLDDKKTIVHRALLPGENKGLVEHYIHLNKENDNPLSFKSPQPPLKKTKYNKFTPVLKRGNKLNDTEVKNLIIQVQRRIPLWNINIPLKDRSRQTVGKLWEEVAAALNGRINAIEAKMKFKSLRDTYRKIVHAEHRSSGSGRVQSRERWKFYECFDFLRDSCIVRPTTTNVSQQSDKPNSDRNENLDDLYASTDADEYTNDTFEDTSSRSSESPIHNRRRKSSDKDNMIDIASGLNRIAEALCRETSSIALRESQKMDTVDAYLTGMGNQIRLLPQRVQMDIIKQFTDIIHDASHQYSSYD